MASTDSASSSIAHRSLRGGRRALIGVALLLVAAAGVGSALLSFGGRLAAPEGGRGTLDVEIQTRPAGAAVFLDGRFAGTTGGDPLILAGVESGAHNLKFEKAGFQSLRVRRAFSPDRSRVRVDLEPLARGSLTITSDPTGAEVSVDGEPRGLTPVTLKGLPPGEHSIVLRRRDHDNHARVARVQANETTYLDAKMTNRVDRLLRAAIEAETDSIAHVTDYAHYRFINGDLEGAIRYYRLGMIRAQQLKSDKRYEDDSAWHDRISEEAERHHKEIRKHYKLDPWPDLDVEVDVDYFRRRMADVYAEVARQSPGSGKVLDERVNELLRGGDLPGAIDLTARAAEASPTNPMIRLRLGELYLRKMEIGDAIEAFNRAADVKPRDPWVRNRLANHCLNYNLRFVDLRDRKRILEFARTHLGVGIEAAGADPAVLLQVRAKIAKALSEIARRRKEGKAAGELFQAAVADLRRAVDVQRTPTLRAGLLLELGDLYALRARRIEPDQDPARAREIENARATYQKILDLTPPANSNLQKMARQNLKHLAR